MRQFVDSTPPRDSVCRRNLASLRRNLSLLVELGRVYFEWRRAIAADTACIQQGSPSLSPLEGFNRAGYAVGAPRRILLDVPSAELPQLGEDVIERIASRDTEPLWVGISFARGHPLKPVGQLRLFIVNPLLDQLVRFGKVLDKDIEIVAEVFADTVSNF